MAEIEFPKNQKEISDRMSTVVKNELEKSNPFLRVHWLSALIYGMSAMFFALYKLIKYLLTAVLPLTAKNGFADQYGALKGVSKNPAFAASGDMSIEGNSGIAIPIDEILSNSSGSQYHTTAEVVTALHAYTLTSLTRSGNIVTGITNSDHNFSTNFTLTIADAVQPEYNGNFIITVVDSDTFTYLIDTTPVTPATGTIIASFIGASLNLEADDFGEQTNQDSGEPMTFLTPVPGVSQTGYVQFLGLIGGADAEDTGDYVKKYTHLYQNPYCRFNTPDIINLVLFIPGLGVTRVFVHEITPEIGDFTVFAMLDNNDTVIPNAAQRQQIKNVLIAEKTPNAADDSMSVPQLTGVPIDFNFTALNPNTQTMKEAVENNLKQFFKEGTAPEQNVTSDSYRATIKQTIDSTGTILISFTLSAPIGDVAVGANEIAIYGATNWL